MAELAAEVRSGEIRAWSWQPLCLDVGHETLDGLRAFVGRARERLRSGGAMIEETVELGSPIILTSMACI